MNSNRSGRALGGAALAFGLLYALPSHALTPTELYNRVSPSVAVIYTLNSQGTVDGNGSGVVVAKNRVITNCHVTDKARRLAVDFGDGRSPGVVVARNAGQDLCLLATDTKAVPPVRLRSADGLQIGEQVYAIGAPYGLERTLSPGLISGKRTYKTHIVIQTTAAISPGSSGGGLFDEAGALIGVTRFYLEQGQSLNFAMPTDWIGATLAKGTETPERKSLAALEERADMERREQQDEELRQRRALEEQARTINERLQRQADEERERLAEIQRRADQLAEEEAGKRIQREPDIAGVSPPVAAPGSAQPNGQPEAWEESGALDRFAMEIQRRVGLLVRERGEANYPRLARERRWEGTTQVSIEYDAGGVLRRVSVAMSSGHVTLDQKATEMVRDALPSQVPSELRAKKFTVRLPLVFKINDTNYYVSFGPVAMGEAMGFLSKLNAKGVSGATLQPAVRGDATVLLGPYPTRDSAEGMINKLSAMQLLIRPFDIKAR